MLLKRHIKTKFLNTAKASLSTQTKIPDDQRILKSDSKVIKNLDWYLRLIRFDKQIGTKLLLLPWYWSIALATPAGLLPSFYTMALFGAGAVTARSAGWVINDYWDKDIDKLVERTKYRPLTTGEISENKALLLFGSLTATCFGIAYLLPLKVTTLGFWAIPLVISYPRFKRFFRHPQMMLGVTFNWGVFMGYAAILNALNFQILIPLYIGSIWWTVFYDTIYAFQDIQYDKQLNLNSSAIELQEFPKSSLAVLAGISILSIGTCGFLAGLHSSFYALLSVAGGHYAWQLNRLDIKNEEVCRKLFISNQYLGLIIVFAFVFGTYFKRKPVKESLKAHN